MQAIEGEAAVIKNLMAAITRDRRHHSIDIIADEAADERQFGDWSMTYRLARTGCCSRDFLAEVKADVGAVEDSALQAAFIGFALLGSENRGGYTCAFEPA